MSRWLYLPTVQVILRQTASRSAARLHFPLLQVKGDRNQDAFEGGWGCSVAGLSETQLRNGIWRGRTIPGKAHALVDESLLN